MQQDKALELKVGIFVFLALAVIAVLMVIFGRVGERIGPSYSITVTFPNANGLLKGADVNLAGAPVGRVKSAPKPLEGGDGVSVDLRIRRSARIREGSVIKIAEVGMLGDRNIEIDPSPSLDAPLIPDGAVVTGGGAGGLSDAVQPILDQINQITSHLNKDVLTPQTTEDLRESIKKLRSVLTRTDTLLADAQGGRGTIGRLLKDPKTADDLSAFISNVRQKGLLFYSDVAAKEKDESRKKADQRSSN